MPVIECNEQDFGDGKRFIWTGAVAGDTFAPLRSGRLSDKTVHVAGDLGGGTISLKGRNDPGLTPELLEDPKGDALTFTTAAIRTLLQNPFELIPEWSGATGGNVTIAIVAIAPK